MRAGARWHARRVAGGRPRRQPAFGPVASLLADSVAEAGSSAPGGSGPVLHWRGGMLLSVSCLVCSSMPAQAVVDPSAHDRLVEATGAG